MTNTRQHFARALSGMALILMSVAVSAQDIVIDSGTDETVISRLPNAPAQEEPVCSDSTDGTLGSCANIATGLVFYETETANAIIPTGDTILAVEVACDAGDVMIGPAAMGLLNHANGFPQFDLSGWYYQRTGTDKLQFTFQLFDNCQPSIGCIVSADLRGLCLDATP